MLDPLLHLRVIGGPVPWIVGALALAAAGYLLIGRPTRQRVLRLIIGLLGGAVVGFAVYQWGTVTRSFGGSLPLEVAWWLVAAFAGVGLAVANLWKSRWWRKAVAIVSIPVFLVWGGLGINAYFGLNPTVADVLGIVDSKPIALPPLPAKPAAAPTSPLYTTWSAPSGMSSRGEVGVVDIPNTASRFAARNAGIYLPPAALVAHAPALPVVVFMMGYPGNPAPNRVAEVVQKSAASHQGLAPIVVVVDQVGTGGDPACADSTQLGNAKTYVMKDVVDWIDTHLNIIHDKRYWTLGGYSNGATCAVTFAALDPDRWGNVLAVSPEEFPGSEYSDKVIQGVYNGDRAAWEAAKPSTILAGAKGRLDDSWAVLTTGQLDTRFGTATKRLAADLKNAGVRVDLITIPGVAHVGENFPKGLGAAFERLYPRLGLAPEK